jgi:hypothetical protein
VTSIKLATIVAWSEQLFAAISVRHHLAVATTLDWAAIRLGRLIVRTWEHGCEIDTPLIAELGTNGQKPEMEHYVVGRECLLYMLEIGYGISAVTEAAKK